TPDVASRRSEVRIAGEEAADIGPGVGGVRLGLLVGVKADKNVARQQARIFDGDAVAGRHRDEMRVPDAALAVLGDFRHPCWRDLLFDWRPSQPSCRRSSRASTPSGPRRTIRRSMAGTCFNSG